MSVLSVLCTRQFQQVRPAPSEVIGCAAVVSGLLASGQNCPVVAVCPWWSSTALGGGQMVASEVISLPVVDIYPVGW